MTSLGYIEYVDNYVCNVSAYNYVSTYIHNAIIIITHTYVCFIIMCDHGFTNEYSVSKL